MAYQVISKTDKLRDLSGNNLTGSGPQILFSNDRGDDVYLVIGAWDKVNHIISGLGGHRPLVIKLSGGLRIEGLTTAPARAQTTGLVVDEHGNIYKQS